MSIKFAINGFGRIGRNVVRAGINDKDLELVADGVVGDLYLAGHPLLASYSAFKAGHALNNQILRVLLEDESAWEVVTFDANSRPAPGVSGMFEPVWG